MSRWNDLYREAVKRELELDRDKIVIDSLGGLSIEDLKNIMQTPGKVVRKPDTDVQGLIVKLQAELSQVTAERDLAARTCEAFSQENSQLRQENDQLRQALNDLVPRIAALQQGSLT